MQTRIVLGLIICGVSLGCWYLLIDLSQPQPQTSKKMTEPSALKVQDVGAHQQNLQQKNQFNQVETIEKRPEQAQATEVGLQDIDLSSCFTDQEFNKQLDSPEYIQLVQAYIDSLEQSNDQQAQLYYTLFSDEMTHDMRLNRMLDYFEYFPEQPLIAQQLINSCSRGVYKRCTNELIYQAIAVDKSNGAIWLSAASYFASKGLDDEVFNAISALEKTSVFNERYGEKVLLYTRALEGSTANNFNLNAITGMGKAAVLLHPLYSINGWCDVGLSNLVKLEACKVLAQQLVTRSKTALNSAFGEELKTRLDRLNQPDLETADGDTFLKEINQQKNAMTSFLIFTNEALLRRYLNNFDQYGEVGATKIAEEDIEQTLSNDPSLLCENIKESFSGL